MVVLRLGHWRIKLIFANGSSLSNNKQTDNTVYSYFHNIVLFLFVMDALPELFTPIFILHYREK